MGTLVQTFSLLIHARVYHHHKPARDPFPSYLDPSLHSDFNPKGHPMDPISSDTFYGILSGASDASSNNTLPLRPPLHSLPQGLSFSTSSANLSRQPSLTADIKIKTKGKKRKFSNADFDQLLCTTIEVNPFAASRNSIGEAWKEVTRKAQVAGYCLGRDADIYKNRVGTLVDWYEISHSSSFSLRNANIYLGGEGVKVSLFADAPGRGSPHWFCVTL